MIWQDTLSFAYYHEGVWIVYKAVGADGHERLYPWFPQQDTVLVVNRSILLPLMAFQDCDWSVSAQLKLLLSNKTYLNGLHVFVCSFTLDRGTGLMSYTAAQHRRAFKVLCFTFWFP